MKLKILSSATRRIAAKQPQRRSYTVKMRFGTRENAGRGILLAAATKHFGSIGTSLGGLFIHPSVGVSLACGKLEIYSHVHFFPLVIYINYSSCPESNNIHEHSEIAADYVNKEIFKMDKSCHSFCSCSQGKEALKLDSMPPAMAYVPWQKWQNIYKPENALCSGTIFQELDLPFTGRRCQK